MTMNAEETMDLAEEIMDLGKVSEETKGLEGKLEFGIDPSTGPTA
jgi:hypothetical protein